MKLNNYIEEKVICLYNIEELKNDVKKIHVFMKVITMFVSCNIICKKINITKRMCGTFDCIIESVASIY